MTKQKTLVRAAVALAAFHFLMVVLHSVAHEVLAVRATAAQLAFIVPVIIVAPVAAGFLLPKAEMTGARLLSVSMTGSFFFGLYYHFIARTIDHVGHVATLEPAFWSAVFIVTAVLLSISEAAGAVAGFIIWKKQSGISEEYAARTNI